MIRCSMAVNTIHQQSAEQGIVAILLRVMSRRFYLPCLLLFSTRSIHSNALSTSVEEFSSAGRYYLARYQRNPLIQQRLAVQGIKIRRNLATSTETEHMAQNTPTGFIDIGANLMDPMFQGTYRGKERHESDLHLILDRAWAQNLERIIITGGALQECKECLALSKTDPRLFCTVGVHPTRCSQEFGDTDISWSAYLDSMRSFIGENIADGKIVAIGELGLDYCRLQFCDKETQKKGFIAQLKIAKEYNLPLFLHNRETGTDLLDILKEHYFFESKDRAGGVVHSFDSTLDLANHFIELGFFIGINGCSLKTKENCETVKAIPLENLLLETDCPWCDIRPSHASYEFVKTQFKTKDEKKYEPGCCVKGRYEPCHIMHVAEVVAGLKSTTVDHVASVTTRNAYTLFKRLRANH